MRARNATAQTSPAFIRSLLSPKRYEAVAEAKATVKSVSGGTPAGRAPSKSRAPGAGWRKTRERDHGGTRHKPPLSERPQGPPRVSRWLLLPLTYRAGDRPVKKISTASSATLRAEPDSVSPPAPWRTRAVTAPGSAATGASERGERVCQGVPDEFGRHPDPLQCARHEGVLDMTLAHGTDRLESARLMLRRLVADDRSAISRSCARKTER